MIYTICVDIANNNYVSSHTDQDVITRLKPKVFFKPKKLDSPVFKKKIKKKKKIVKNFGKLFYLR